MIKKKIEKKIESFFFQVNGAEKSSNRGELRPDPLSSPQLKKRKKEEEKKKKERKESKKS